MHFIQPSVMASLRTIYVVRQASGNVRASVLTPKHRQDCDPTGQASRRLTDPGVPKLSRRARLASQLIAVPQKPGPGDQHSTLGLGDRARGRGEMTHLAPWARLALAVEVQPDSGHA